MNIRRGEANRVPLPLRSTLNGGPTVAGASGAKGARFAASHSLPLALPRLAGPLEKYSSVNPLTVPATESKTGFWTTHLPLWFFEIYLLASLAIFAFGPLELPVENPTMLYGFALTAQAAILIGYLVGIRSPANGYRGYLSFPALVQIAILLTCVVLGLSFRFRNYIGISVTQALADPSLAYYARLEQFASGQSTSFLYSVMRALAGPMLAVFIPCGVFYWRQMDWMWRGFWLAGAVLFFADCILTGAAKGLFDIILVLPWLLWAKSSTRRMDSQASKSKYALTIVVSLAVITSGIGYFSYSREARFGLGNNSYPPGTVGWSQELYGVTIPEPTEFTIYMVARYWTHGYYGLAGCLQLPFEWSYGVGHSSVWMKYAGSLSIDPDAFWLTCYPARLEAETGYSTAHYWHTMYPWIASDLTFPGAILFVGLMAFLMAQAWNDTLRGLNPFAIGFCTQVILMFYYIPANNGRLMYPEEALSFWGLLACWRFTRV